MIELFSIISQNLDLIWANCNHASLEPEPRTANIINFWENQYRGSSLSTIFGILKKSYYAKFVLLGTT